MVVVDPIILAMRGDSNTNGDVRRDLQPLVAMAERTGAVLLGISHFSKGSVGRNPVERVTGSLAFAAAARIVLVVAKVPEDQGGGRVLCRAKSNLGPDGGGFKFGVRPVTIEGAETIRVEWGEAVHGTAHDLLDVAEQRDGIEERSNVGSCVDWLRELLIEAGGAMERKQVLRIGKDAGHYEKRVERAAAKLGIKTASTGFGAKRQTNWRLP
jgi:hypothetical protein